MITRDEKRGLKRSRDETGEEDVLPSDDSQATFLASCVRSQILFEPGSFLGLRITATELTEMDDEAFSLLMARINVMLAQAAQWNAARSQKNAQSVPAIPAENEAQMLGFPFLPCYSPRVPPPSPTRWGVKCNKQLYSCTLAPMLIRARGEGQKN